MAFSLKCSLGRWHSWLEEEVMTTFTALANCPRSIAAAGVATVAFAALMGSAVAITPTLETKLVLRNTISIARVVPNGTHPVYTVPANRTFMLTDLIGGNAFSSISGMQVYLSSAATCAIVTPITGLMVVPALNSLVVPLTTGIRFGAGQTVCISNPFSNPLHFTARGYHYQ
jgi:hypothetical protein